MKLNEAIEVLKDAKYIGSDEYASDYDREMNEAIDTVLSHINTGNKTGLDDRLQEKSIEVSDSQEGISNKKDRINTAKDMEDFAEWVDNHHTVEVRTGKQLRELWEKERGEK